MTASVLTVFNWSSLAGLNCIIECSFRCTDGLLSEQAKTAKNKTKSIVAVVYRIVTM